MRPPIVECRRMRMGARWPPEAWATRGGTEFLMTLRSGLRSLAAKNEAFAVFRSSISLGLSRSRIKSRRQPVVGYEWSGTVVCAGRPFRRCVYARNRTLWMSAVRGSARRCGLAAPNRPEAAVDAQGLAGHPFVLGIEQPCDARGHIVGSTNSAQRMHRAGGFHGCLV